MNWGLKTCHFVSLLFRFVPLFLAGNVRIWGGDRASEPADCQASGGFWANWRTPSLTNKRTSLGPWSGPFIAVLLNRDQ